MSCSRYQRKCLVRQLIASNTVTCIQCECNPTRDPAPPSPHPQYVMRNNVVLSPGPTLRLGTPWENIALGHRQLRNACTAPLADFSQHWHHCYSYSYSLGMQTCRHAEDYHYNITDGCCCSLLLVTTQWYQLLSLPVSKVVHCPQPHNQN